MFFNISNPFFLLQVLLRIFFSIIHSYLRAPWTPKSLLLAHWLFNYNNTYTWSDHRWTLVLISVFATHLLIQSLWCVAIRIEKRGCRHCMNFLWSTTKGIDCEREKKAAICDTQYNGYFLFFNRTCIKLISYSEHDLFNNWIFSFKLA